MPFVILNCAAIPENLLKSELFGYAEGAFTGALKGGKKGKIEQADGGTLLLDEINSMPLQLQAKPLRGVQEKEIQVIGGKNKVLDVRFVFTTNQDLSEMVKEGKFREDLYYRINVVELRIPPLRERMGDIPPLENHIIEKLNEELGSHITGVDKKALELLESYQWPGNVHELENMIERAFNYSSSGELSLEDFERLRLKISISENKLENNFTLQAASEDAEKLAILRALKQTKGNKKKAAELLNIDRSILGVIGMELATAYNAFGTTVTIIEAMSKLLPMMDGELTAMLRGLMEKKEIEILTGAKVLSVGKSGAEAEVQVDIKGSQKAFKAEKVLVAVGRRTDTAALQLEKAGIRHDRGKIQVNEYMETSVKDVYAIGDCLSQIMLAHIASALGEIAAENALGHLTAKQTLPAYTRCLNLQGWA